MADVTLEGAVAAVSTAAGAVSLDQVLAGAVAGVSAVEGVLWHSVAPTAPAPSASGLAPGGAVEFEFLGTAATNRIEDFEGAVFPSWWLNCSPANGFTATGFNDGTDQWDIFDDGGDKVLRAQGRATALAVNSDRAFLHCGNVDTVVRVRWYTGATAGVCHRCRHDSYAAANDFTVVGAEIDSGGLRLVFYSTGTRNVRKTAAFTPSNGTWYYVRMQSSGPWGMRYRAKYWTGARSAEPASWNLEHDDGTDIRNEKWAGHGVHVQGGTAYFNDYEIVGEIDPVEAAKLTAEFNGKVYATTDPVRTLSIEPYVIRLDFFPAYNHEANFPDINKWRCSLAAGATTFDYDPDGTQTVEVKFDGTSIKTWTFNTTSFPGDPFDETGGGDPDRIALWRTNIGDVNDAIGRRFIYLVEKFLQTMGRQEMSFAIAPVQWRANAEDFQFVAYSTTGFPVDGQYWIAHPVLVIGAASVVPGIPKINLCAASVIPKGSLGEKFVASLVPQGYKRTDTVSNVVASVRFWYAGRASGIVSVEFLKSVAGSGVIFDTIRDNTAEVQVIDEATYQALIDAGVTWS